MEITVPTIENPCLDCKDFYMNHCVKSAYCMKYAQYYQQEHMIKEIREANIGIGIVRVKDGNGS